MTEGFLLPNKNIVDVLLEAYSPCCNIGRCDKVTFDPLKGLIPRGVLGATGELSEVQVVFVFSEPGHAHGDESYDNNSCPMHLLCSAIEHTYRCFKHRTDKFHRNTRWVMDQLWPNKNFDEQLEHAWLTEGRLCSIDGNEIGKSKSRLCAPKYLALQLKLLAGATVITFGNKAKNAVNDIRGSITNSIFHAYALAPPGANSRQARPSWEKAIAEVIENTGKR